MSHRNARLTPYERLLLVRRIGSGRPVSHVAKELGVSRQCAHHWLARYRAEGEAGLIDRSSRPRTSPGQTSPQRERAVLACRAESRRGPLWISRITGVPARTVTRVLNRHQVPRLADCDPVTGIAIRAVRQGGPRYEYSRPGALIHVDVKKLGRIPDGGGWRILGPGHHPHRRSKIGFDYVHAAVDDHTRLAYAEIHPDETVATCAAFLLRAADWFAAQGVGIDRVMTDNAMAYQAHAFRHAVADLGARQRFIKPHCPWTNGKVERFNRTLQTEWAYRRAYTTNTARTRALDTWLDYYNAGRPHTALDGHPPISRLSPI